NASPMSVSVAPPSSPPGVKSGVCKRPRSRRCVCRPADKAAPAPTAPQAGADRASPRAAVPWWRMPGTRLAMFPLSAVLFPHATMPLHVFEPRYRELLRDCLAGDARFGIVLIERGSEGGGGDERSR